ncbi:MAG: Uma2 family endonuclease [Archangiaceae bacterium]|nr:Uma2 family endonuclease [Archangiaceae bacterium]
MLNVIKDAPFDIHRIDRAGYHRLGESGAFEGKRVQLIEGVIIAMNARRGPHATAVMRLTRLLTSQVGDQVWVRAGLPLAISPHSEPEPDFALVSDADIHNDEDHPSRAALVIEVADSSRVFDLGLKARLYAAAKIPEYWVVDLQTEKLVVHLDPKKGEYQRVHRFGKGREVTSAVAPKVTVRVAALF